MAYPRTFWGADCATTRLVAGVGSACCCGAAWLRGDGFAVGEGCAVGVEGVLVPVCREMPATLISRTFGVTGAESTSVFAGRCDFSASASCGSAPGAACWAPRLEPGS